MVARSDSDGASAGVSLNPSLDSSWTAHGAVAACGCRSRASAARNGITSGGSSRRRMRSSMRQRESVRDTPTRAAMTRTATMAKTTTGVMVASPNREIDKGAEAYERKTCSSARQPSSDPPASPGKRGMKDGFQKTERPVVRRRTRPGPAVTACSRRLAWSRSGAVAPSALLARRFPVQWGSHRSQPRTALPAERAESEHDYTDPRETVSFACDPRATEVLSSLRRAPCRTRPDDALAASPRSPRRRRRGRRQGSAP